MARTTSAQSVQAQSSTRKNTLPCQKIQQLKAFLYTKKIERLFAKKGVLFYGALGLNTLCRGCSIHTKLVRLLYRKGDKSEKVCIGYKVQPTKRLNLLKESECCASVQIVLCNFFLYINNIKKYYSVSRCIISIIIVFAPAQINLFNIDQK